MTNSEALSITIEVNGSERTIEAKVSIQPNRAYGVGYNFWGRFPTGMKAHRMPGMFWRCEEREDGKVCIRQANGVLRFVGFHATVGRDQHGTPWLLDATLYEHNRNVGRLVGWIDQVPAEMIARWH